MNTAPQQTSNTIDPQTVRNALNDLPLHEHLAGDASKLCIKITRVQSAEPGKVDARIALFTASQFKTATFAGLSFEVINTADGSSVPVSIEVGSDRMTIKALETSQSYRLRASIA